MSQLPDLSSLERLDPTGACSMEVAPDGTYTPFHQVEELFSTQLPAQEEPTRVASEPTAPTSDVDSCCIALETGDQEGEDDWRPKALAQIVDECDRVLGRFEPETPMGGFADDVRTLARNAIALGRPAPDGEER